MVQRYQDWSHVHVVGDQSLASAHLPYARKLLGEVMEQAEVNQLGTHVLRRRLADGTQVIAEKHGTIPRITIVTAGGTEAGRQQRGGDFVVWARDDARPAGIDADHPQQILQRRDGSWRTFFYSESTDGYDSLAGSKGTYIGSFPDGIQHAGNVDWCGPGEQRVSWYGPSTRYWTDPYVQPRDQFGKHVFMLGQKLLDVATYQEGEGVEPFAAQWVMGAAIDGLRLLVMHAELPVCPTTTSAGAGALIDPWFSIEQIPHVLATYALIPDAQAPGFYQVAGGSREVLWSGSLRTGAMPWFFHPEGFRAHCFGIPAGTLGGIDVAAFNGFGASTPPTTSSPIFTMTIEDGAATLATTSVTVPPNGSAAIAGDYDIDGNLVEVTIERQQRSPIYTAGGSRRRDHWLIKCGGASGELFDQLQAFDGTDVAYPVYFYDQRRYVLFADARSGLLVLALESVGLKIDIISRVVTLEIYVEGVRVHSEQVTTAPASQATGLGRSFPVDDAIMSAWAAYSVNPMFALYGFSLWSFGITTGNGFQQAHGGFLLLPYQAGRYFGGIKYGGAAGATTPVSSRCSVTAARERHDREGKDIVLGAACYEGAAVFSGYGFEQGQLSSVHFATEATLPALTGVAGQNQRFHPVWILGKPLQPTEPA